MINTQDFQVCKWVFKTFIAKYFKTILLCIFLMLIVAISAAGYAFIVKEVLDKIFIQKDAVKLATLPFLVIAITIIKNSAFFIQVTEMEIVVQKISKDLKLALFSVFTNSDIQKFDNTHTSEMKSKIIYEADNVTNGINVIFTTVFREVLTIFFLVVAMFYQNPSFALMVFSTVPFIILPVVYIAKRIRRIGKAFQSSFVDFMRSIDESLQSIRLVKSNATEEFEITRLSGVLTNMLNIRKKIIRTSKLQTPIVEMISVIGIAFVIWYGGHRVFAGTVSTGEFFAFFTAMTLAYKPLKSMSNLNIIVSTFLLSAGHLKTILSAQPTIVSPKNPIYLEQPRGNIIFDNVSFWYSKDKQVLKNLSFNIKSGQKVAFIGHTGAGKSTIINLILRLYDVSDGQITFDGINIKNLDTKQLKSFFAYVGQDIQLFDDTIVQNIRYVKPQASLEDVIHAAKIAHADEFIVKMSHQYDSRVGQMGSKLSGGQKQRLSIARAILKDAQVLLLDEPTSALDSHSETLIQDAIRKISSTKTTITIAHRLSTIKDYDMIFVLDHGQIVEAGTHEQLLAKAGHYYSMYRAFTK